MSIVDFKSSIWTEPWFRKLSNHFKLLYIYLFTNNHKNNAGLYAIDIETIAFETGITIEQVENGLVTLESEVKYDFENSIIWVVEHVKHQFMKTSKVSPKIIVSLEKALLSLNKHPFIGEFMEKYEELQIPYPHIDSISGYPTGKGKGESGGNGSGKGGDESETRGKSLKDGNGKCNTCIGEDSCKSIGKTKSMRKLCEEYKYGETL